MKWFVYLVGEVLLVLSAAWAIDRGWTWLCLVAAMAGGAVFFFASWSYRRWILTAGPDSYLPQFGITGAGILVVVVGCVVLQRASDSNRQWLAAVGIAVVFAGILPVAHFIRTDMESLFASGKNVFVKQVVAWELNAIFIAAAVVPGLLVLGASLKTVGLLSLGWWLSSLVDRLAKLRMYWIAASVMALLLAVTLLVTMRVDLVDTSVSKSLLLVGGGLFAALGLIDGISAYARHAPTTPTDTRKERLTKLGFVAAAAVVVGGVAAYWMVDRLGGVRGSIQTAVIVSCVAFGASFIARGQGFALVALFGALLVWTVQDRNTELPIDPGGDSATGTIVALGDSYIAGEGSQLFFTGTNVTGGNDCRRSPTAFPYLVAQRFHKSLVYVACSGALASQIWHEGQIRQDRDGGLVGSLPQLSNPFPTTKPDLVLISIGGNDALFGEVGKGCAFPGTCVDLAADFTANLPRVGLAVADALRQVSATFPDSPIVVVPYPQMLAESGCNRVPFDGPEFTFLHGFVEDLDATIRGAVATVTAEDSQRQVTYFAQGETAYAGQELCSKTQTRPPINTITLSPTEAGTVVERMTPTNWTHMSFHPTQAGHEMMAAALEKWLPTQFDGFGSDAATVAPEKAPGADETVQGATPTELPPETCPARKECQAKVSEWMTRHALDALRGVLLPALLLLGAGWFLFAFGRRYIPPRRRSAMGKSPPQLPAPAANRARE